MENRPPIFQSKVFIIRQYNYVTDTDHKYLHYLNKVAEIKQSQEKQNENIEYLTEDNMDISVEGKVLNDLKLTKQFPVSVFSLPH